MKGNTVFDTLLGTGISATGIVAGNYVSDNREVGIGATGIVTGNIARGHSQRQGIVAGPGSTVIGNTATDNEMVGIVVDCPSNVTDNTAINNPEIARAGYRRRERHSTIAGARTRRSSSTHTRAASLTAGGCLQDKWQVPGSDPLRTFVCVGSNASPCPP